MSKYNRKSKKPKADEFVSFWHRLFEMISPYVSALGVVSLTALVILFAVWGITSHVEHRAQNAAEQFGKAVKIYDADLLTDATPESKDELNPTPRFKTAKERADAALAELDKLDKEWGSTDVAKEGALFRAGVLFDQQRYDDAAGAYDKYLKNAPKDASTTALAREGLGLCDEARNKLDDALAKYKELESLGAKDFYRDRALYAEARVWTKKGDKKKAAELYKEILAKTPTTPLKDEVQTQLALVGG
jgi:predicted negative regulator of RcsB-dependent stress response